MYFIFNVSLNIVMACFIRDMSGEMGKSVLGLVITDKSRKGIGAPQETGGGWSCHRAAPQLSLMWLSL